MIRGEPRWQTTPSPSSATSPAIPSCASPLRARRSPRFGLAVNRRFQRNGQWEEQTSFFDVTCWGQLGENVSQSLPKGTRVVVTGRLDQRSWETQDGEKRSKVEVVGRRDRPEPALGDVRDHEERAPRAR